MDGRTIDGHSNTRILLGYKKQRDIGKGNCLFQSTQVAIRVRAEVMVTNGIL